MELTIEDKHRIEQWANSKRLYSYEDRKSLIEGAEYATIYERQQQAKANDMNTAKELIEKITSAIENDDMDGMRDHWDMQLISHLVALEAERSELVKENAQLKKLLDDCTNNSRL